MIINPIGKQHLKAGYGRSLGLVAGLLLSGVLLHFAIGAFRPEYFRFPANAGVLLVLLLASVCVVFAKKTACLKWLAWMPLSVTVMTTLLLFSLVGGILPSSVFPVEPTGEEGSVFRSWPFVLTYGLAVLNLSAVVMAGLRKFASHGLPFHLTHLGLLLLLLAAGFGSTDRKELYLKVFEDGIEDRAYESEGLLHDLPFTVRLTDFQVETLGEKAIHQFRSLVEITTEDGTVRKEVIEVNHPLQLGAWMMYQYDFDWKQGEASRYSVFQLVYDPWLPLAYAGMLLFFAGAIAMIWRNDRNRTGKVVDAPLDSDGKEEQP